VLIIASAYKGDYIISSVGSLMLLVVGWLMTKVKTIDNFKVDLDDKSLSVNQKENDEPKD
jgi:hypothetical protein